MAANKGQLTPVQNDIFHENYRYMWEKLSVTYYQVSQTPEKCPEIHGREYLPSYAYLCRCMKDSYVPTVSTVNKIVDFYNANILPRVSGYQFVNERLSAQDAMRRRVDEDGSTERICGTYCGYYLSPQQEGKVCGALMRIQSEGDRGETKSRCVYYADGFSDAQRMERFGFEDLSAIKNNAVRLYAGEVQINDKAIFVNMHGVSNPADRMCLAMRYEQQEKSCGTIAVVMRVCGADASVFFVGLTRRGQSAQPDLQNDEKELVRLLKIRSENLQSDGLQVGGLQEQKWRAYLKKLDRRAKKDAKT